LPPTKGKELMIHWGIQFGLMKDYRGIQVFALIRHRKRKINVLKSIMLKKTPLVFVKAPEEKDPTVLTEKPNTYALTPEDIRTGNFERPRGLEPEEIGDVKL